MTQQKHPSEIRVYLSRKVPSCFHSAPVTETASSVALPTRKTGSIHAQLQVRRTGSGSEQWATMWPSSPAPPSAACNGVNVTHWHTFTGANKGSWQAGSTSGKNNEKLLIYRKWRIFFLSFNTSKREPRNFTQRFHCWCVCFWQTVVIDWCGFHSMDQSGPSDPDWSETCSVCQLTF